LVFKGKSNFKGFTDNESINSLREFIELKGKFNSSDYDENEILNEKQ
jgi:hypothetical protein